MLTFERTIASNYFRFFSINTFIVTQTFLHTKSFMFFSWVPWGFWQFHFSRNLKNILKYWFLWTISSNSSNFLSCNNLWCWPLMIHIPLYKDVLIGLVNLDVNSFRLLFMCELTPHPNFPLNEIFHCFLRSIVRMIKDV